MDGKRKDPDGFPVHQDGLPIHLDEAGIRMDFASVQGVGAFVKFIPEQSVLIPERNGVFPERNVLLSERNVLLPERNVLLPERNGVVPERNGLLSERNGLLPGGKKAGRLPLMQWRQFNLNGRFRPDGGCLFLASPRKRHEKEGDPRCRAPAAQGFLALLGRPGRLRNSPLRGSDSARRLPPGRPALLSAVQGELQGRWNRPPAHQAALGFDFVALCVVEQRRVPGAAGRRGGRAFFLGTSSWQDKKKYLAFKAKPAVEPIQHAKVSSLRSE